MKREDIFHEEEERNSIALPNRALLRDQFRIGRVLGVGGFGITYLAFDEVLEMIVAVKEYLPHHIAVRRTNGASVELQTRGETSDFRFGLERFLEEARTLAKFEDHANIVRVRTFFEANGTGYLVMNYYEGRALNEYLESRTGLVPEDEAVYLMHEVLNGLESVHEAGILHRDVDPSNVYLANSGRVVLLDFGAARTAVGERTQTLSVMLKRGYAPHEQYHSHGQQGPWTDIYACAATMYRLVTGYKPPEAAARVMDDELVPPKKLTPTLSQELNDAIVKGLSLWPKNRPQTVAEFRKMLPAPVGPEVAGWTLGNEPRESIGAADTGTGQVASGAAALTVRTTQPCRFYVDGDEAGRLDPDEPRIVRVEPGVHRLRAVRVDHSASSEATVTESEASTDSASQASLDTLIWQYAVNAVAAETVDVLVSFDGDTETASATWGGAEGDGRAPGADATLSPDDRDRARTAALLVRTDRACRLFVDTDRSLTLDSGRQRVRVEPGTHLLRAVESDGHATWEQTVDVVASAPTSVSIMFSRAEATTTATESTRVPATERLKRAWNRLTDRVAQATASTASATPIPSSTSTAEERTGAVPSSMPSSMPSSVQASVASMTSALPVSWPVALAGLVGVALLVVAGTLGVQWAMTETNEPPILTAERVTTDPGTPVSVNVVANDVDPENEGLHLVGVEPVDPSTGRASVADTTTLRFEPAIQFAGTARIGYIVRDAHGDSARAHVDVVIPFGAPEAVTVHDVSRAVPDPQDVHAADLDGDGDQDLVVASYDDRVLWMENDGTGTFGAPTLIDGYSEGVLDVHTADLDGDGDLDVVAAAFRDDRIAWYENRGPNAEQTRFGGRRIVSDDTPGAMAAYAADFDGDGDADLLTVARTADRIALHENRGPDADPRFGPPSVVADGVRGMEDVHVTDLDGDGTLDVLTASFSENRIYWFKGYGDGRFNPPRVVSDAAPGALSVFAVDVDGDGDEDVLSGTARDDAVVWYETLSDSTTVAGFSAATVLTDAVDDPESIVAADLDADGDPDVLTASFRSHTIAWHENQGGTFGARHVLSTDAREALVVRAFDADGDRDLDVLSASQADDRIAWYENRIDPPAQPDSATVAASDSLVAE